jgi:hypothetical protein
LPASRHWSVPGAWPQSKEWASPRFVMVSQWL